LSKHHSQPTPAAPSAADALADGKAESLARKKVRTLWQEGALFHVTSRYPRRRGAPKVDRLARILQNGLLAPAQCQDDSVCSDLHIVATGTSVPYDGLVFLHRFGRQSAIYTMSDPGRFAVFVDPDMAVLTPSDMGPNWVVLCQDEVYVRDAIGLERVLGIAVHPANEAAVLREFATDFRRLGLPLYDYDRNVLWPRS
jgi:hypothetical protein